MRTMRRILAAWIGAVGLVFGMPRELLAASPDDEFFGAGLEEFTGLRHSDVHEIADKDLETMRGRYGEVYLGFDGSSLGSDHSAGIVVTGTIPSNGGKLVGQVTVRDTGSNTAYAVSTNLLTDSFNNAQGVVQLVQIAGNNNVVYQNLKVDIAVFFGSSPMDPGYTAFRNYVQGRGTRP